MDSLKNSSKTNQHVKSNEYYKYKIDKYQHKYNKLLKKIQNKGLYNWTPPKPVEESGDTTSNKWDTVKPGNK